MNNAAFSWQVSGAGGRRAPLNVPVSISAASKRREQQMHVTELHKPLCLKRKDNFTPLSPLQVSFLSLRTLKVKAGKCAFPPRLEMLRI